jgi:hypothetical protein
VDHGERFQRLTAIGKRKEGAPALYDAPRPAYLAQRESGQAESDADLPPHRTGRSTVVNEEVLKGGGGPAYEASLVGTVALDNGPNAPGLLGARGCDQKTIFVPERPPLPPLGDGQPFRIEDNAVSAEG